jgi:hypothetical protein
MKTLLLQIPNAAMSEKGFRFSTEKRVEGFFL